MNKKSTRLLSDREQMDIRAILHQAQIGYLGLVDDGPYVVPINFAYDGGDPEEGWGRILFHSNQGRKSRALEKDARVCLAVTIDTAFDPADQPCEDRFTYRSVLVWGSAVRLEKQGDRQDALRMMVAKYDSKAFRQPFDPSFLERVIVYELPVSSVGYKYRAKRT